MQRKKSQVGARGTYGCAIYSPFLVSKILLRTCLDWCQLLLPSAVNKHKIIAFVSPVYQRFENIYTIMVHFSYNKLKLNLVFLSQRKKDILCPPGQRYTKKHVLNKGEGSMFLLCNVWQRKGVQRCTAERAAIKSINSTGHN